MPNIKPVSDLRNYTEVLKEVTIGSPVYLTKNGRGEYAIVKMQELDELRSIRSLFSELEKGEVSAREKGWISPSQVEAELGI
jgi:hypothetical protein